MPESMMQTRAPDPSDPDHAHSRVIGVAHGAGTVATGAGPRLQVNRPDFFGGYGQITIQLEQIGPVATVPHKHLGQVCCFA